MDELVAWDTVAGYLTSVALEKGLSDNTSQAYRLDLTDLVNFCQQKKVARWEDVTSVHILDYLKTLYDLEIAPATIARRLSAFRGFFRYLLREETIKKNPAELIEGPRMKRKLPDVLSVQDIEIILDQPDTESNGGIRDRAILEMMYGSGLRVSEVIGIRLDDLLLDGELLKVTGKGSKQRIVPVGDYARQAVAHYLSDVRSQLVRDPIKAREVLFLSIKLGKALTRQAIFLMLKAYVLKAGLNANVTPHTLRHSFATHLIEGGAGLREVQELLGHVSIDTTMIYTHLDRTHLLEVVRTCHPREKVVKC